MPLLEDVVQSVSNTNFKVVAESPGFYTGLAMGEQVSHQGAMNKIREAAVGSIVKALVEMDPGQAASINKALTGNDLAQQIAQLVASLGAGQQLSKQGNNAPPSTPS